MQCEFRVPWTPGKIEAIAYRKGKEIARTSQATAGTPAKIDIDIENKNLKADCQDISIISISQKTTTEYYTRMEKTEYMPI